ncbi:MAG: hypothetical protein CM15mP22_2840 [Gammaproteobacteria bacterium]|nr:MAG: hypothetical protein CM15mP22_2840 [Gammaproteobacteria bacterium]
MTRDFLGDSSYFLKFFSDSFFEAPQFFGSEELVGRTQLYSSSVLFRVIPLIKHDSKMVGKKWLLKKKVFFSLFLYNPFILNPFFFGGGSFFFL